MPTQDAPDTRLTALLDHLKQRGHRMTPQRLAIIRALVGHSGHPTVDELHRIIQAEFPTTSLATVYKTIAQLKTMGEVLELGSSEPGSRYDGRRPQPHPHLICTRCGIVVDPDPAATASLDALVRTLALQAGFTASQHRLDIFGLCPACRPAR